MYLVTPAAVWIESIILCAVSLSAGAASYFLLSYQLFNSEDYLISNLVDIILGRESVYFLVDDLKVNNFIRKYKAGLITSAISFIFFVLIYILNVYMGFLLIFMPVGTDQYNFNFLQFIISLILIGSALYIISPNKKLNQRLCSTLNKKIRNLQTDYEEVRKLKRIIPQIRKYASSLHIFFPITYIADIQKEIKNNAYAIFAYNSLIKNIINDKIELSLSDKNELEKANKLYLNFIKFYQKVSSHVLKTKSISHINQLNYLLELMDENKTQLLTNRKWKDFESTINDFLLALDELNGLALSYIYNGYDEEDNFYSKKENDPYVLLEVNKDMTDEEIRRKWKQLLEEFHPDRADNTTDGIRRLVTERAQAINNAYNKIKKERNL